MKTIYTIQDHGPTTFGLYLHGKRLCVVSDCAEETAQRIAAALNPRDMALLEQVERLTKERDEALAIVKKTGVPQ